MSSLNRANVLLVLATVITVLFFDKVLFSSVSGPLRPYAGSKDDVLRRGQRDRFVGAEVSPNAQVSRYSSDKYPTQVIPQVLPLHPGWNGTASQLRILITGGAGFIGSHLVDKLMEEGHAVTVLDNLFTGSRRNVARWFGHPRFQFLDWDVILPLYAQVDQIYHLACPASPVHYQKDPVFTIKTNVMGTLNMLGLATRSNARILLASTSEVYGDPLEHPQTEEYRGNVNTTGVRSCYDEGKRVAETLCFDFHRERKTDIRVARIFNTFGDRMNLRDGRVVSNFIINKLKGESLVLYGGGMQTRSFCFVDDLVEGLYRLMNTDGITGPINLGNPNEITIRQLAETISLVVDEEDGVNGVGGGNQGDTEHIHLKAHSGPLPSDDPLRRKPDISKAKRILHWEPKYSLREGLTRAIAYFRKRLREVEE